MRSLTCIGVAVAALSLAVAACGGDPATGVSTGAPSQSDHEKLRAADRYAITNYLRVSLINIHDELVKRLDVPAVAQSLLAGRR